jgi:hypothetical protein
MPTPFLSVLYVGTVSSNAAQVLVVTGSGKNARIEVAAQSENQAVVHITYDEDR